ncbi:ABC transporter permease [Haladaptatus caseinilyticus]|uniref:ABC transporter permease n=1 Tax=Haladaptatus caseinilyticus TaxID=2993314 RepID=UPI00224A73EE|nr:ABC transporter permease [Haladaptatus caseinilyticus]
MSTESARSTTVAFGTGTSVLAVVTVQLLAFSISFSVGRPELYAVFAVLSAGGLALVGGRSTFGILSTTLGTVLLVALALPLLMLVARQSPASLLNSATDPSVQRALFLSVYAPLLSAMAAVTLGVPLAIVLARGFPGQPLVESLVDLPLVVPHSVAGLAVLFAFGRGGILPRTRVLGTLFGMVLAMTFVSAPFAVNAAREGFERVDSRVERAARTLGADEWETFRRVTAPLAARSILTGGVLAWGRAVSEFGAVAIVAYGVSVFYPPAMERVSGVQHAPVFIYNTFLSSGLEASGSVATLLLVLCVGIFLLVRSLAYDRGGWP